jgi:hypothetical protein
MNFWDLPTRQSSMKPNRGRARNWGQVHKFSESDILDGHKRVREMQVTHAEQASDMPRQSIYHPSIKATFLRRVEEYRKTGELIFTPTLPGHWR